MSVMIIRAYNDQWLMIGQSDHACISAELAKAMALPPFDDLGFRDEVIAGIAVHDDGWKSWDERAVLDPELGRPRGFAEMTRLDGLPIWRQSIEAAGRVGGLAHGMVAGHFLRLAKDAEPIPELLLWRDWANDILASANDTFGREIVQLAVAWLRFFDGLSLNLCRGSQSQPFPLSDPSGRHFEMAWVREDLATLNPWPFGSAQLALDVEGLGFPLPRIARLGWTLKPVDV